MRNGAKVLGKIASELIRGDVAAVDRLTQEAVDQGIPINVILKQGLIGGMQVIGVRFKNNEIFLPEVLVAARAMKAGVAILEPFMTAGGINPVGKVVIGTVKGDIHDIGKNLVTILLRGAGFEVVDLGVGVSAEKFIEAIDTHEPDIVGMSALLTTTMIQMKTNITAFSNAGMLGSVKVLVGGAPVNQMYASEIGADAYGRDAADAVEKAKALMTVLKNE